MSRELKWGGIESREGIERAFSHVLNRIEEAEQLTVILNSGVSIVNLKRFYSLTPTTRLMLAGNPHFQSFSGYSINNEEVTWV